MLNNKIFNYHNILRNKICNKILNILNNKICYYPNNLYLNLR